MNTYKLDITQEEVKGYKSLGAVAYAFMALFALVGLIILILAIRRNAAWHFYGMALNPLLMAFIIYFQLKGSGFTKNTYK